MSLANLAESLNNQIDNLAADSEKYRGGEGGKYLKWKDGPFTVRFMGAPTRRFVFFRGGKTPVEVEPGGLDDDNNIVQPSFEFPVKLKEDGRWSDKVLTMKRTAFDVWLENVVIPNRGKWFTHTYLAAYSGGKNFKFQDLGRDEGAPTYAGEDPF